LVFSTDFKFTNHNNGLWQILYNLFSWFLKRRFFEKLLNFPLLGLKRPFPIGDQLICTILNFFLPMIISAKFVLFHLIEQSLRRRLKCENAQEDRWMIDENHAINYSKIKSFNIHIPFFIR
jgi:hypothetical protein